jgi:hypothetical protein
MESTLPVILTFDIQGAPPKERNRIQCAFERFGWENLGGSSYRYPRLGADQPVEDWFNHVVPALMLFRTYVIDSGRPLSKFTLDVQSSTGANPLSGFGNLPLDAAHIPFYTPNHGHFGLKNLRKWVKCISYPYKVP